MTSPYTTDNMLMTTLPNIPAICPDTSYLVYPALSYRFSKEPCPPARIPSFLQHTADSHSQTVPRSPIPETCQRTDLPPSHRNIQHSPAHPQELSVPASNILHHKRGSPCFIPSLIISRIKISRISACDFFDLLYSFLASLSLAAFLR